MPERVALFIDGANLHATTRGLHAELDFRKLLDLFAAKGRLLRALYYTAVVEGEEFSPVPGVRSAPGRRFCRCVSATRPAR